jgi:hypothetical protein
MIEDLQRQGLIKTVPKIYKTDQVCKGIKKIID